MTPLYQYTTMSGAPVLGLPLYSMVTSVCRALLPEPVVRLWTMAVGDAD